jgi:hypothetical protein
MTEFVLSLQALQGPSQTILAGSSFTICCRCSNFSIRC